MPGSKAFTTLLVSLYIILFSTMTTTNALTLPTLENLSLSNDNILRRQQLSQPTLPTSSLPQVPANLTLKYIALGQGIQNYTCTSITPVPVAIGAVATLYDVTSLFFSTTTTTTPPLLALSPSGEITTCLAALLPQLSTLGPLFSATSMSPPNILGSHYFNSVGTPIFDLVGASARLAAKKVANAPAPAGDAACANADGKGAVDWLMLVDAGAGQSVGGLKAVYRVETAGGKAPASCIDAGAVKGVVASRYAALYWFYG